VSRRSSYELTTTSYALLGMLAIRPWTTYELAKSMNRGLGQVWPRARSNLFKEPKKLVTHGLATATNDPIGRRPRTVYAITPKGREALRDWLGTPGHGPQLEFEQFLKVFFADAGSKRTALAAIRSIGSQAEQQAQEHILVGRRYLDGAGVFPERAAILAITGCFLAEFTDLTRRWAAWAETVIETWPDDPRRAQPDWSGVQHVVERLGRPAEPHPWPPSTSARTEASPDIHDGRHTP
jgi:PadR family transcriptional regulator AphA